MSGEIFKRSSIPYQEKYVGLIARFVVKMAYRFKGAERYQQTKRFFYNILENQHYQYKRYFDIFMMVLIFSSVFILIREVRHSVNDFWAMFNDYIISIVFFIEYVLRFWVVNHTADIIITQYEKDKLLQRDFRFGRALFKVLVAKWKHATSISAIIDLLAIMPFFHELRLLRLFILFRVFKIFRYTQNMQYFGRVLAHKKFELFTLLTFASVVIFVSSVLIYVMEANNDSSPINTLFDAFYWSIVTISTVGYGDVTPVTKEGQSVAIIVIIAGIAVISFATSIVVSAFTDKLDDIRENKMISDISKLKHFYLICGYGDVAHQTASKLRRSGRNVVVLDTDEERVKQAVENKLYALKLDPASFATYQYMNINLAEHASAVLLLRDSDVLNVYTALTLRDITKKLKMLAILHEKTNRRKLQLAGVRGIVYAQEIVGILSKEYSGKPIAFETMNLLRAENSSTDMTEIVIDELIVAHFKNVKDLNVHRHRLVLIGISKLEVEDFVFNPEEDVTLQNGDILVVVGEISMISEFRLHIHNKKRS